MHRSLEIAFFSFIIFSISVLAIIIFVACSSETNKETEVKTETNQIVEQSSDSIIDATNPRQRR